MAVFVQTDCKLDAKGREKDDNIRLMGPDDIDPALRRI